MAKIDGIKLPANLGDSLGGTPEESAKVFLSAASKGLAQVIANALTEAVGEAAGAPAPDWTKLISGALVNIKWETPPDTIPQTVVALAQSEASALGGGLSVHIGISADF
jgi:hypothetical protein